MNERNSGVRIFLPQIFLPMRRDGRRPEPQWTQPGLRPEPKPLHLGTRVKPTDCIRNSAYELPKKNRGRQEGRRPGKESTIRTPCPLVFLHSCLPNKNLKNDPLMSGIAGVPQRNGTVGVMNRRKRESLRAAQIQNICVTEEARLDSKRSFWNTHSH